MAYRNASEDGPAGRAVDGIGQGSSRVHARAGGIGKRVLPGTGPGRIHADRRSWLMTQITCRFQLHGNCTEPWAFQSDGTDPDIRKKSRLDEKKENKPCLKVWI